MLRTHPSAPLSTVPWDNLTRLILIHQALRVIDRPAGASPREKLALQAPALGSSSTIELEQALKRTVGFRYDRRDSGDVAVTLSCSHRCYPMQAVRTLQRSASHRRFARDSSEAGVEPIRSPALGRSPSEPRAHVANLGRRTSGYQPNRASPGARPIGEPARRGVREGTSVGGRVPWLRDSVGVFRDWSSNPIGRFPSSGTGWTDLSGCDSERLCAIQWGTPTWPDARFRSGQPRRWPRACRLFGSHRIHASTHFVKRVTNARVQ